MTNAEMIEVLRLYAEESPEAKLLNDAADALEADEKRILDLETALAACRAWRGEQAVVGVHADGLTAEELKEIIKRFKSIPCGLIDEQPTIDAVEVKHGEWIEVRNWLQIPQEERGTYRCSACGQVMKYPWNYCPNCGARMDGAE